MTQLQLALPGTIYTQCRNCLGCIHQNNGKWTLEVWNWITNKYLNIYVTVFKITPKTNISYGVRRETPMIAISAE